MTNDCKTSWKYGYLPISFQFHTSIVKSKQTLSQDSNIALLVKQVTTYMTTCVDDTTKVCPRKSILHFITHSKQMGIQDDPDEQIPFKSKQPTTGMYTQQKKSTIAFSRFTQNHMYTLYFTEMNYDVCFFRETTFKQLRS